MNKPNKNKLLYMIGLWILFGGMVALFIIGIAEAFKKTKTNNTMESNNSVGKEEIKAGDKWLEYIKQFPNLELAFKNCLSETQQLWFAQQIDIFANKYPQPLSPQSSVGVEEINCKICSRIIEEEAHHCEISDCPHRNNDGELTAKKICRKHLNDSQWYAPLLEPKIIAAMTEYSSLMNKTGIENFKNMTERCNKYDEDLRAAIEELGTWRVAYEEERKITEKLQQLLSEKEKEIESFRDAIVLINKTLVESEKQLEYWKQRCEAAEDVFYRESFPGEPAWEKWQQLKQSPIN